MKLALAVIAACALCGSAHADAKVREYYKVREFYEAFNGSDPVEKAAAEAYVNGFTEGMMIILGKIGDCEESLTYVAREYSKYIELNNLLETGPEDLVEFSLHDMYLKTIECREKSTQ